MDIAGGPAALGGVMMCVALAAWTLGRWQGGLVTADNCGALAPDEAGPVRQGVAAALPVSAAADPCQHAARAEHKAALATASSLGDVHAEISAYRRAEQVLVGLDSDPLTLIAEQRTRHAACGYPGIIGELTYGPQHVGQTVTGCEGANIPAERAAQTARPVQPSPSFAADLTRV